jgi:hypothetical protein
MPSNNPAVRKGGPSLNPSGRPREALSLGKDVIAAMHQAFETVGKHEYLVEVAQNDPKTFCAMISKVIPSEVNQTVQHTVIDLSAAMAQANERLEHMATLIDITPSVETPDTEDKPPQPAPVKKWR